MIQHMGILSVMLVISNNLALKALLPELQRRHVLRETISEQSTCVKSNPKVENPS